MKIAVVSPRVVITEFVLGAVRDLACHEIAWVAGDGAAAVEKCRTQPPDLVLIDLGAPETDGVEATRMIMELSPCPILVMATTGDRNTARVFEAMSHGALDAVNIPLEGKDSEVREGKETLLKKIEMIEKLGRYSPRKGLCRPARDSRQPVLVVIGASAGGPKALAEILSHLPADLGAGIVIVQHLNREFSDDLAVWLNGQTGLDVRVAPEGARPARRTAFLAGTGNHLIMTRDLTLSYVSTPEDIPFRPSVDLFFSSVARFWPSRGMAVLLTGMGRDGAEGLAELKRAGWHTVAQDEASSVIYGMPKAARDLGAADRILPLNRIAPSILNFISMRKTGMNALSWEW